MGVCFNRCRGQMGNESRSHRRNGGTVERGEEMSYDNNCGLALGGEFTASELLKLFSYEPPKFRIPTKIKYSGSRKALRELKKARGEK